MSLPVESEKIWPFLVKKIHFALFSQLKSAFFWKSSTKMALFRQYQPQDDIFSWIHEKKPTLCHFVPLCATLCHFALFSHTLLFNPYVAMKLDIFQSSTKSCFSWWSQGFMNWIEVIFKKKLNIFCQQTLSWISMHLPLVA